MSEQPGYGRMVGGQYFEWITYKNGCTTITRWRPDPHVGNCIRCNATCETMGVHFLCDGCRHADQYATSQEIFEQAAAEIERLRAAARALLDGVNERYPDKNPREWTCPHMAELDRLVPPEGCK